MVCDRYAFATAGTSSARRSLRRYLAVKPRPSCLPAGETAARHRPLRAESAQRHGLAAELLAAEARIAELESALRQANETGSHDPLTGAFNRRGMHEAFAREAARARRNGQPLAMALIDLDDFKAVNDRHGHAAGDAALVHLTRVIAETLRPTDLCCRLGGEEFVLVMPGSTRAAAKQALLRLAGALAARPVAGSGIALAFSAGVVLAKAAESIEQMLARADQAVYRAKAAGKGRVVVS